MTMSASTPQRLAWLIREHFPDVTPFDARRGGFSPLPWVLRSLMHLMTAREWSLLCYFYLRSGPQGLSWETDQTIGLELGIGSKKVGPYVRRLEQLGFIATRRVGRNRYVKLVDPTVVAERLLDDGTSLTPERRARLQDDLNMIEQVRHRSSPSAA